MFVAVRGFSRQGINQQFVMRTKTIHRSRLTKNFTTLPNELLQNNAISHLALGLLCRMLSLPADWETNLIWIYGTRKEGKQAMQVAVKELESLGYLKKTRLGTGKMLWEWFDHPQVVIPSEGKASEGIPPTTKDTEYKGAGKLAASSRSREGTKNTKGGFVPKRTGVFRPKYPYPETEDEMYHLLDLHGVDGDPDHDGGFFNDFSKRNWRMPDGSPVYDWVETYNARLEHCAPGR